MRVENDDRMLHSAGISDFCLRSELAAQAIELPSGLALSACRFTIEDDTLEALAARLPAVLERAPLKRKIEFLAGRRCAATALRELGCEDDGGLPIGPRRAPTWPAGFVGSISHGDGLAVAVAAQCGDAAALGIDIQLCPPPELAQRLALRFSQARECQLGECLEITPTDWITRLWAIKESVIKALDAPVSGHPPTRFGFLDIEIAEADRQSAVVLLRALPGRPMRLLHGAIGAHAFALCSAPDPRTDR